MKKIGIITLTGNTNYGNKLQNYALKTAIEKITDMKVETIWLDKKTTIKKRIKGFIKFFIKNKDYRRQQNIKKFNMLLSVKKYKKLDFSNEYSKFVIGSDQVWNYNFTPFDYNLFFSLFSSKEKNISYAASIGVNDIENKYINIFKRGINNINSISVREDKAKEIIKKISGRKDIEVLVDPTMLLTADDWKTLEKKPKNFNEKKYILTYFLGNISDERKCEIKKTADKYNCSVINLMDYNSKYYSCGPREFLWLERNAFLICTDSFHASVFSILFDKPFLVFKREQNGAENMMSRIDTLLSKMKLDSHVFDGKIDEDVLVHNYDNTYKIIEEERKKSFNYLERTLCMKDGD